MDIYSETFRGSVTGHMKRISLLEAEAGSGGSQAKLSSLKEIAHGHIDAISQEVKIMVFIAGLDPGMSDLSAHALDEIYDSGMGKLKAEVQDPEAVAAHDSFYAVLKGERPDASALSAAINRREALGNPARKMLDFDTHALAAYKQVERATRELALALKPETATVEEKHNETALLGVMLALGELKRAYPLDKKIVTAILSSHLPPTPERDLLLEEGLEILSNAGRAAKLMTVMYSKRVFARMRMGRQ
jgi:hypothetical protein